ncbi:hypothetical protein HJG60_008409 [Phyllostomus discolor]|uniref:Uncharacterized protein n=1 Tax=Phyllostomus discolor TaxID=89673 RepID=A0A833Z8C9_9CHIR|nr:hypothetical protein HJG60_008409 [Phyllostomus discolor]
MSKIVRPQAAAEPRPPWCVRAPQGPRARAQAAPARLRCRPWHGGRHRPRLLRAAAVLAAQATTPVLWKPPLGPSSRTGALLPRPRRGEARAATHSAPPCVLLLGSRLVKKIVSMYCIFCTCLHL